MQGSHGKARDVLSLYSKAVLRLLRQAENSLVRAGLARTGKTRQEWRSVDRNVIAVIGQLNPGQSKQGRIGLASKVACCRARDERSNAGLASPFGACPDGLFLGQVRPSRKGTFRCALAGLVLAFQDMAVKAAEGVAS